MPQDLEGKQQSFIKKRLTREKLRAQLNLGMVYATGHGVLPDLEKAAELFQKAADQGDADAQYNLGVWLRTWTGRVAGFAESKRALSKSGRPRHEISD